MPERGTPPASDAAALRRMRTQRQTGTKPEIILRRVLHARGFRYRVDAPLPLPGLRRRADLLFRGARVAVFVDGCYWHSCPEHGTKPKANAPWWSDKLAANVARDRETDQRLAAAGWLSIRVWEHEPPDTAANRIEKVLHDRNAM
jgi:DNA mismatch endonuclease (patch repair protein)